MELSKLMKATFWNPFTPKKQAPTPSTELVKEILERAKAAGIDFNDRQALRKFIQDSATITTSLITGRPYGYKIRPKTKTNLLIP